MSKSEFESYFKERANEKQERNRTANIPESLHTFYKNTANNFEISISTLLANVLVKWKDIYGEEVKKEIISRIKKRGF